MTSQENTKETTVWEKILNWLLGPVDSLDTRGISSKLSSEPPSDVEGDFADYAAQPLKTAVVHLKTDQVIKGALSEITDRVLVLKHASLATAGPSGSVNWTRMDGDVVVSLANVDFWQDGLDAALLDRTIDLP